MLDLLPFLAPLQAQADKLPKWAKLALVGVGYGLSGLGAHVPQPWGTAVTMTGATLLLVLRETKPNGSAPTPDGK